MALEAKRYYITKQKHKVSHFYFYFVKKWDLGLILFIFISLINPGKPNELTQSLHRIWAKEPWKPPANTICI